MDPGCTAGVLIWKNLWAAPFASAARRSGGQLITNVRIPIRRSSPPSRPMKNLRPKETEHATQTSTFRKLESSAIQSGKPRSWPRPSHLDPRRSQEPLWWPRPSQPVGVADASKLADVGNQLADRSAQRAEHPRRPRGTFVAHKSERCCPVGSASVNEPHTKRPIASPPRRLGSLSSSRGHRLGPGGALSADLED